MTDEHSARIVAFAEYLAEKAENARFVAQLRGPSDDEPEMPYVRLFVNEIDTLVAGLRSLEQARIGPSDEKFPIPLNERQEAAAKSWAADDRLWTTQETVEFNLRTFARAILKEAGIGPWLPIEGRAMTDRESVARVVAQMRDRVVRDGPLGETNEIEEWADELAAALPSPALRDLQIESALQRGRKFLIGRFSGEAYNCVRELVNVLDKATELAAAPETHYPLIDTETGLRYREVGRRRHEGVVWIDLACPSRGEEARAIRQDTFDRLFSSLSPPSQEPGK